MTPDETTILVDTITIPYINEIKAKDAELARLRADLAEARAALDRATESKPFSQHDELKHLRTSNHYMTEELTRLRAERKAEAKDLAEARADVQRFEAALDASQRELAEAKRKLAVSETLRAAASQSDNEVAKSTLDYYAMEKRKARTYEKLAASYTAIASRQRRTIRALVVAFRDALHLTRRVASDDTWNLWLQLVQRQAHERRESERNQTSRD